MATEAWAFFSYSHDDSEFALRLAKDLKAAGANVWLDQLELEPGKPWDLTIQSALTRSPRVLVILSPASVSSPHVLDEFSFALNRGKTVIPVLYRDCETPYRLDRLQHVDFKTDYDRGLKELLKTLGVGQQAVAASGAAASGAHQESQLGRHCVQRMPFYVLVDCSHSMEGEPREALEAGLKALLANLRSDPQALETVWISLVVFARDAWQITPLTPIESFDPPTLFTDVYDQTAFGSALRVLNNAIEREVVRRTDSHPGDYCPLVLAIIGRDPTDEWLAAAKQVTNRRNRKIAALLVCAVSPAVDIARLRSVAPRGISVVNLSDFQPDGLKTFFRWIEQEEGYS